jgi:hypothetical protein
LGRVLSVVLGNDKVQRSVCKLDPAPSDDLVRDWILHEIDPRALAADKVGLERARRELVTLYAALLRGMNKAELAILAYGVQTGDRIGCAHVLHQQLSRSLSTQYCSGGIVIDELSGVAGRERPQVLKDARRLDMHKSDARFVDSIA